MRTPLYKILYVQVLAAIAVGILLGHFQPDLGVAMKPFGDAFIQLIKMVIGPIIFCTVVTGIAGMGDMKKVGRVGGKALIYFEVVSTLALVIGLIAGFVFRPGDGFNADPSTLDASAVAQYTSAASESHGLVDFLIGIIPHTITGAFADGNILQILLVAILCGAALSALGEKGVAVTGALEKVTQVLFKVVGFITRVAPIGAFGAMAFTVGKYGIGSLGQLFELVASFYITAVLFVLVVLGTVARLVGFSILRFIAYIKEELLIVLGTSSSESALPQLIQKMERAGCPRSVVGLVVPTGYSFNLDGTNIYMTLAVLFIAQATNTELGAMQLVTILLVAMLTSKGASGVTGAGFITLAATLSVVPDLPVAAMVLILGVDRFMSECRSLTNFVGNGVATLVVSAWEGQLDRERLQAALRGEPPAAEPAPEDEVAPVSASSRSGEVDPLKAH
ncbi:dicarboxylate/amino acid:cation symporter [Halotalea alkalilenta]|uniref:dicarboxylate/amino acid:cation symporter n=1 Tax=Halotalea alkalilenta TaxID=376489 RepID=UPI000694DD2A|nr:dicarboxylate/amino acid:cation symporter [Halotalea alkalilenta]